jgi:hypothetical protein
MTVQHKSESALPTIVTSLLRARQYPGNKGSTPSIELKEKMEKERPGKWLC